MTATHWALLASTAMNAALFYLCVRLVLVHKQCFEIISDIDWITSLLEETVQRLNVIVHKEYSKIVVKKENGNVTAEIED